MIGKFQELNLQNEHLKLRSEYKYQKCEKVRKVNDMKLKKNITILNDMVDLIRNILIQFDKKYIMARNDGFVFTNEMWDKLEEYRLNNYMSKFDLCKKIDIAESTLYYFKSRKTASLKTLKKIKDNI